MVSIKDIATEMGVSIATVSMALNDKDQISKETKEKVKETAKRMGYQPSMIARALKTNHTKTIGMVVGSIANDYFLEEIAAVEDIASEKGYGVFLCDARASKEGALAALETLLSRNVEIIILTTGFYLGKKFEKKIAECIKGGTICVTTSEDNMKSINIPCVSHCPVKSLREVIEKLYAYGHRKVGVLATRKGSWLHDTRFRVIREELQRRGIYSEELVMYMDLDFDSSVKAAGELLAKHPEITSIFAINDVVAMGILSHSISTGIKVPEDLSIVGFDGVKYSQYMNPKITTIKVPTYETGRLVVEKAIESLEGGKKLSTIDDDMIECSVKWGQTIGPVRN